MEKNMKEPDALTEYMLPRYQVMAEYPQYGGETPLKKGEIIRPNVAKLIGSDFYDRFPDIFKKLEWWQGRTISEMMQVKKVRVIEYVGYWRVDDVVDVSGYSLYTGVTPSFKTYLLGPDHQQKPHTVVPVEIGLLL